MAIVNGRQSPRVSEIVFGSSEAYVFRARTGNDSSTDARAVFGVVGLDRTAR